MVVEGSTSCCCGKPDTDTPALASKEIKSTDSVITLSNRLDHMLARLGYDRFGHKMEPGLYKLGAPSESSPVFVTANYTLSFDALRSALEGVACYILVLDTRGVNVWCAAGKGTFSTDEVVRMVEAVGLRDVVDHKTLILPQLGAPGVAAHLVKKRSGFKVEYGPVLAKDLPEYLQTRKATSRMRRMRFPLRERAVLIPLEVTHAALPGVILAVVMYFLGGAPAAFSVLAAAVAGLVLFPMILPVLPFADFSVKGFALGAVMAVPFVIFALTADYYGAEWARTGWAAFFALFMMSATAYLSLNFTGSTTFTSQTGVKREIFAYAPFMFWMFVISVALAVGLPLAGFFGV